MNFVRYTNFDSSKSRNLVFQRPETLNTVSTVATFNPRFVFEFSLEHILKLESTILGCVTEFLVIVCNGLGYFFVPEFCEDQIFPWQLTIIFNSTIYSLLHSINNQNRVTKQNQLFQINQLQLIKSMQLQLNHTTMIQTILCPFKKPIFKPQA